MSSLTSDACSLDVCCAFGDLVPATERVEYSGHVGCQLNTRTDEPQIRCLLVDVNIGEALLR